MKTDNTLQRSAVQGSGDLSNSLSVEDAIEQKSTRLLNPVRLLLLLVVSIFLAEAGIMLFLNSLEEWGPGYEALLDATALVLILSPIFYYFHYRPLEKQDQERRQTLRRLHKSEERLKLAMQSVDDGLWDWSPAEGRLYFSPRMKKMFGYPATETRPTIEAWEKRVHPLDRVSASAALRSHLEGQSPLFYAEYRLQNARGGYLWVLARGRVVERDSLGRPLRVVGTLSDIGARKHFEQTLQQKQESIRQLSHQLMNTSEQEKKNLAQDLHDEFGQVLTAFQLGVEMLRNKPDAPDHEAQCDRLLAYVARLEKDLRQVCDRLRPPMLDDIGLLETLRWEVGEFARNMPDLKVCLELSELPRRLPLATEVALYRICQEALNNISKHASARVVTVSLQAGERQVSLKVEDDGSGRAQLPEAAGPGWGMGLLGMRERAEGVGGALNLVSVPGRGTTVEVIVALIEAEGEQWQFASC